MNRKESVKIASAAAEVIATLRNRVKAFSVQQIVVRIADGWTVGPILRGQRRRRRQGMDRREGADQNHLTIAFAA